MELARTFDFVLAVDHFMFADVLPNVLAHAPYESVFGLACSCRALSRIPIERADYEVEEPIEFDDGLAGSLFRYPNGVRLRMRVAGDSVRPYAIHVVYASGVPWAAFVTGGDAASVLSLETGVRCDISSTGISISGTALPQISVTVDGIYHAELTDDRVIDKIAATLKPVLSTVAIDNLVSTFVDAIDIFARHIGISRVPAMMGGPVFDAIMCERSQWN